MPQFALFNTVTRDYRRHIDGGVWTVSFLEEAVSCRAAEAAVPPEKRCIRDMSDDADLTWYRAEAFEIHKFADGVAVERCNAVITEPQDA